MTCIFLGENPMNNKPKDRYENKLNRFIKECDKRWRELKNSTPEYCHIFGLYNKIAKDVQKELGLTEDDVQRAWSLRRHHSDRHFWCDSEFHKGEQKQNAIAKAERKLKPDDEVLEQELKDEDDWIMDVYDAYYDPEDMSR